jgi:hypothetical protein
MRNGYLIGGLIALALVGCSKREAPSRGSPDLKTFDVTEASSDRAPPSFGPTAAPGVAFSIKYDFSLADEKISAVQEAHAARCEALGVARCRITGLNYTIGDNDTVTADLAVKLAPDIARGFGREASATVTQAGGRLSHTEFSGEDTAPATDLATSSQSNAAVRIAAIERQLAAKGPRDAERAQLQAQLDALRSQGEQAATTLADNHSKLAATPMTFSYYGKGGINGFAGQNPLLEAGRSFVASLVAMITFVLQLLAYVLPWLLLLGVLILLWRTPPFRAVKRWWKGRGADDALAD